MTPEPVSSEVSLTGASVSHAAADDRIEDELARAIHRDRFPSHADCDPQPSDVAEAERALRLVPAASFARVRVIALTEDERDALTTWNRVEGTTTWLEAETVYAAVERILAQRAAPDPTISPEDHA